MGKEQNVIEFYLLCNKLKDVVRSGWQKWGVDRFRVESIAEHVYGTQMLAIAMWSEYKYDIDLYKTLTMLAVHEMEEIIIGDLTIFETAKESKQEKGHIAVNNILSNLSNAENIKNLIHEFDERKTKEAKFAYFCDKLECDIQAKLYDEQNCVDLNNQENNKIMNDKDVKELLNKGLSWSDMWIEYGQKKYNYDDNFMAVSNFIENKYLENEK